VAETKEEITAERDQLRTEVEQLRGQLAAAGARVPAPQYTFQLSEGDRQELVQRGVVNIGGRRMTREDVAAELSVDQLDVELGDATPVDAPAPARTGAVEGVDFIYPSVAPGLIDPAVAGTPGINGPAAE
jgi:hypothetical protein